MKIVIKDNFDRDVFLERVVATNVTNEFGEIFVKMFNDKYHTDTSEHYLALVEDDYIPYDGYKETYGE